MRKVPKLRFKEFSDEWEENKLEELTTYVDYRGKTPKKVERGILLVTAKNIKMGYIDYNISKEYVAKENYDEIMRRGKVKKGEVLLTTEAPLGNVAQIDDENIALAQRVIKFAGISLKIDNSFLKYRFITEKFQTKLKNKAIGTTVLGIQGKVLHKLLIKYPLLQEQEKIANFLSSVDKKISLTEEKLELFREYKKGVMQKIFSQELRFKDSDDNDYPEWEEKKLEEVAECLDNLRKPLNSNEREKIKGSIPYYGANGIQGYINNYIFNEELVLLAEDGGNFDDYLTKPIAQYVQGKSWINNHAHVLKGKKVLKTKFLYFSLVHKDIRSFINGTSRSKLNKSSMLNIIILLPALEEQEKIADFLSSIDSKIENIEKELEGLKEFKKGLLQQMFV